MGPGKEPRFCCLLLELFIPWADILANVAAVDPPVEPALEFRREGAPVELGQLDPEMVVTPGIFVKRVVKIAALRKVA